MKDCQRSPLVVSVLMVLAFFLHACGKSDDGVFQGYVEGEYVYLSSAKAGRLERLVGQKGRSVAEGTLLAQLESEYERQALVKAEENLAQAMALYDDMQTGKRPQEVAMAREQLSRARAERTNAASQLARDEKLFRENALSPKILDAARAEARAADASVRELERQVDVYNLPEREKRIMAQKSAVGSMEAAVGQARWDLEQKRLVSPENGLVVDTLYREGEWVPAGSPVIQLLPPKNVKIRFFVPETALAKVRLGATVRVSMDGTGRPIPCVVTYVAQYAEFTPPVIYSNETRSKLSFLVEAKPEAEIAKGLHPGQPVTVELQ